MSLPPAPPAAHARRRWLARGVKLLALIGAAFAAWPFIATLLPDAPIDAAHRQRWERVIDLSPLRAGETMNIDDWPGGPVAVYRRSALEIEGLTRIDAQLHDPHSQQSGQPDELRNTLRSHLPEYFVFIPAETARGCHVRYVPANKPPKAGIAWYGGFADLCMGSVYDTAGRVFRAYRSESQQNLTVPDHRPLDHQRLLLTEPASPR